MEIQSLNGFLAVAQLKSFSKAAKKTFRTQPAISLQIKALEEELQVKLFSRTGQKEVLLTEEGKIFLSIISPLLSELDSVKERFNEARKIPSTSKITIATHASVMSCILPEILSEFKKQHPQTRLTIFNRSRSEIVQMVKDGEADIGISSLTTVPASLEYDVFYKFPRVLVLEKNHLLSNKKNIKISDLKDIPLIASPRGSITREQIEGVFSSNNLALNVALEVSDRAAIKSYIKMGLGASILNAYYLDKQDEKYFSVKDVSSLFGAGERGIIKRKGKYIGAATKDLIEMLKKY